MQQSVRSLHSLSHNAEKYNKFPQSARKANHLQIVPPAAKLHYFPELTKYRDTFYTFCILSLERKRLPHFYRMRQMQRCKHFGNSPKRFAKNKARRGKGAGVRREKTKKHSKGCGLCKKTPLLFRKTREVSGKSSGVLGSRCAVRCQPGERSLPNRSWSATRISAATTCSLANR